MDNPELMNKMLGMAVLKTDPNDESLDTSRVEQDLEEAD
jgi:hypothetical protein